MNKHNRFYCVMFSIILLASCIDNREKKPTKIDETTRNGISKSRVKADGGPKIITVNSKAIEGNLLEDTADRNVIVYLPPTYAGSPDKRYPVVYLLHGYSMHNTDWTGGGNYDGYFNILPALDSLMTENPNSEMIIVMPDCFNKYGGSWYTNSSVTGDWEDFIVQELIGYIDDNYRTLSQAASRGIAGYSMGGIGALCLSLKYPEIYSAVYGISCGRFFAFEHNTADIRQFISDYVDSMLLPDEQLLVRSIAAAYSPNPDNPPYFIDLPFKKVEGEMVLVETAWEGWLEQDPVEIINSNQSNTQELPAIRFDCGRWDETIDKSRAFSRSLTEAGIAHVFEEYDGNHHNRIAERIVVKVMPFFQDVLQHEKSP